eukprot:804018-Amphidinium_carterae.1
MSLAWVLSFKESELSGINTWLAPLSTNAYAAPEGTMGETATVAGAFRPSIFTYVVPHHVSP